MERGERLMPSSAHAWTVLCRACDIVIGTVEGGRFVHDPTCTRPLAIGAGLLRCCRCSGRLDVDAQPVAASELEELPAASVLRLFPSDLDAGDNRQRL
jgi:hypothetical protein